MSRIFTDEIYDYLYSNIDFVVFLNSLYSSYDLNTQDIELQLDDEGLLDDFNVYIRLFLSNVEPFISKLLLFENNFSSKNVRMSKSYVGRIKGHLEVSKHIKNKVSKNYPKDYPCIVKKKDYGTEENIYILFYSVTIREKLLLIRKKIQSMNSKLEYSAEIGLITHYIKQLDNHINLPQFDSLNKEIKYLKEKYSSRLTNQHYDEIVCRVRKGKVVNGKLYTELISWIKNFEDKNLVSNNGKSSMLRYDNESFCNKLFEIWVLFSIRNNFINKFGFKMIKENTLVGNQDDYIFHLNNSGSVTLYIYFQKGKKLYWDVNKNRSWIYSGKTYLRGIPDITIKKEENYLTEIIMIDAKNRIRESGQNSEEVYKVIGYFDNFKESIPKESDFKKSYIIFRNDRLAFKETLVSSDEKSISNISVGIIENEEVNNNQFLDLCHSILQTDKMF